MGRGNEGHKRGKQMKESQKKKEENNGGDEWSEKS